MTAHTHAIDQRHGARNTFVPQCPACERMKMERDRQAATFRAVCQQSAVGRRLLAREVTP